jgi:hypothetical protein
MHLGTAKNFRCPSEFAVKWDDVNLPEVRIRIEPIAMKHDAIARDDVFQKAVKNGVEKAVHFPVQQLAARGCTGSHENRRTPKKRPLPSSRKAPSHPARTRTIA